jgi:type II secretory pathway component PulM
MSISTKIATYWNQRSPREKVIGVVAIAFLAVTVVYPSLIVPIGEAFSEQSRKLRELKNTYSVTPDILERYSKLVARRKDIDSFYSKVDLSSEPLSYLESLLKDTAQAGGTYNVTPRDGVQLGGKYSHKFFVVNFQTASYENLVAFLKALTSGKQPMLISQINLEKRAGGENLNVQLEVSGFESMAKK